MLHGYDRGHREIARSLALDDEARSTMLVLSDLIVDGILSGTRSYLTCYPLRSIARHVLSCTWSAGPKFRPGSVWTHSLLLDYQALAQLSDLTKLKLLFQHPSNTPISEFNEPLMASLDFDQGPSRWPSINATIAIAGIYGEHPLAKIEVPSASQAENDSLALALWRQMWPALRRDFAFVTSETGRSSPVKAGCVLQFSKGPFQDQFLDRGQSLLLKDLSDPGPTALRSFLSRYVVESGEPRSLAPELVEIWERSATSHPNDRIAVVGNLIRSHDLGRLKRDLIAAELQRADGNTLIDIVREFGDDPQDKNFDVGALRAIEYSSEQARTLLRIGYDGPPASLSRRIFDFLLAHLEAEQLVTVASEIDRGQMLAARPDLAFTTSFWPSDDSGRARLLEALPADVIMGVEDAITLFGADIGPGTATVVAERLLGRGAGSVDDLINSRSPALQQVGIRSILSNDEYLDRVLGGIDVTSADLFERMAAALIEAKQSIGEPSRWLAVGQRIVVAKVILGRSTQLVLTVSALTYQGDEGLELLRHFWDRLYTDVRWSRLNWLEERWVQAQLPSRTKSYSLRSRLVGCAVESWPLRNGKAGALLLSDDRDNSRDLIRAVEDRWGKSVLTAALHDNRLSAAASGRIREILTPPRKPKSWWF